MIDEVDRPRPRYKPCCCFCCFCCFCCCHYRRRRHESPQHCGTLCVQCDGDLVGKETEEGALVYGVIAGLGSDVGRRHDPRNSCAKQSPSSPLPLSREEHAAHTQRERALAIFGACPLSLSLSLFLSLCLSVRMGQLAHPARTHHGRPPPPRPQNECCQG